MCFWLQMDSECFFILVNADLNIDTFNQIWKPLNLNGCLIHYVPYLLIFYSYQLRSLTFDGPHIGNNPLTSWHHKPQDLF